MAVGFGFDRMGESASFDDPCEFGLTNEKEVRTMVLIQNVTKTFTTSVQISSWLDHFFKPIFSHHTSARQHHQPHFSA